MKPLQLIGWAGLSADERAKSEQRGRYRTDISYRQAKLDRVRAYRDRDRDAFRAQRRDAYARNPEPQKQRTAKRYASLTKRQKRAFNKGLSEARRKRKAAWTEERWELERAKRRERRRRQREQATGTAPPAEPVFPQGRGNGSGARDT